MMMMMRIWLTDFSYFHGSKSPTSGFTVSEQLDDVVWDADRFIDQSNNQHIWVLHVFGSITHDCVRTPSLIIDYKNNSQTWTDTNDYWTVLLLINQ